MSATEAEGIFVHPRALNESRRVGKGTRIWAFAHIMEGAVIGRDCNIGDHCFVETGAVIGCGATVKNGVFVWDGVVLADYVFVGPNAVFTNDRRPRSPRGPGARERYAGRNWLEPTRVCEGATIGANATVRCGVRIGRYAMIAAGAVVTRDVADFELVAGGPARNAGWVCMCGERLADGHAPVHCTCGRKYHFEDHHLALVPSA